MFPVLRQALLADIPELLTIESLAFGRGISRRGWRHLVGDTAASVVVAEDDRSMFGDYVLIFDSDLAAARLQSVAVAPERRRRGVAHLLVEDAMARAIARGAAMLMLETAASNTEARQLFESLGFLSAREAGSSRGATIGYEGRLVDRRQIAGSVFDSRPLEPGEKL